MNEHEPICTVCDDLKQQIQLLLIETNWSSTYDFIHNKKRNRLTESDPRSLDKISAVDYTETTVECEQWSVAD